MGDTEDAHDDIPSMLSKLSSSQTGRGMFVLHRVEMRYISTKPASKVRRGSSEEDQTHRPGLGSKGQGIPDGKCGEMNVLLGGVDGLAPEILGHRLWADTCLTPESRKDPRIG